jgi:hypothetical protein
MDILNVSSIHNNLTLINNSCNNNNSTPNHSINHKKFLTSSAIYSTATENNVNKSPILAVSQPLSTSTTLHLNKPIIAIANCSIFQHQVGGHSIGIHSLRGGLLKYNNTVLKPVNPNRKGQCEKDFYLFKHHPTVLQSFIPKFHGFVYVKHEAEAERESAANMHEYIQLEDLSDAYTFPSIIDIKIGTQTFDEEASLEKMLGDKMKYIHQATLGMRVIGMKIHRHTVGYLRKDKVWGRELTEQTIKAGLQLYFDGYINTAVPIVIQRLKELLSWFSTQTDYRFYSSSLLILYESNQISINNHSNTTNNSGNLNNPNLLNVRVCMVDFTHVYGPARSRFFTLHDDSLNRTGLNNVEGQKDDKYSHGLIKLINILSEILNENQDNPTILNSS